MSGQNGNGNGSQPQPSVTNEQWDRIVDEAVEAAFARRAKDAKREAGNDEREIVQPLLLGPQRYRDPNLWSPRYHLRGAPLDGSENSQNLIDEMKRVPLTRDERLIDVLGMLGRLNAASTDGD